MKGFCNGDEIGIGRAGDSNLKGTINMARYELTRTGKVSVTFDGEPIAEVFSAGKPRNLTDTRHARWWECEIYYTATQKWVAQIRYRVGVLLSRELPIDHVIIAGDADALVAGLNELNWESWVTGWPRDGRFDDRNLQLMDRLKTEWQQLVMRVIDATKPTLAEEV